jgi:hypothetical protein
MGATESRRSTFDLSGLPIQVHLREELGAPDVGGCLRMVFKATVLD